MRSQVNNPELVAAERAIVREHLGLSDDHPIELNDDGWDSRAYVVDGGAVVFKFARDEAMARRYRTEIAALRLLENIPDTVGVSVPNVRWEAPDNHYFGYDGIVGEVLATAITLLTAERRHEIGTALGRLVAYLHTQHIDAPIGTIADELANYEEKRKLAAEVIDEHFTTDERARIDTFLERDLANGLRAPEVRLVLAHGDLGPLNIIVSDDDVGVIDFGDIGYYDPANDFAGFGDPVITAAALDAYGADVGLRTRAALRAAALPILDIPFFVGKRDDAGVRRCIAAIRSGILDGRGASTSR